MQCSFREETADSLAVGKKVALCWVEVKRELTSCERGVDLTDEELGFDSEIELGSASDELEERD